MARFIVNDIFPVYKLTQLVLFVAKHTNWPDYMQSN